MSLIYPPAKLYTSKSDIEGRGVFAAQNIPAGEIIEEAPILEFPEEQVEDLMKTDLLNYFFGSGRGFKNSAIILGYGSLYNHSYSPNAKYVKKLDENVVKFVALKDIPEGTEILINYKGDSGSKFKLWFE